MPQSPQNARELFGNHSRRFQANRYVYPVLSRRAGGISIGVNLNRDKACNFNCVYCQVDRSTPGGKEPFELDRLADELQATCELVVTGRIFEGPKFSRAPDSMRRLNDIALSGDGESTLCGDFAEAVAVCAEARKRCCPEDTKLVLITNAGMLDRPAVRRGLTILDAANGEIWAKLDAGTEAYFRLVARTNIPFQRILDNLAEAARQRPIVIQSLFARIQRQPPPPEELDAYCLRLKEIVRAGGRIKLIQIHTVARPPGECWVSALSNAEVDALAEQVRRQTDLPVARFYG